MRFGYSALWHWLAAGGVLLAVAAALVAGYFDRLRRLRRIGSEAARARTVRARAPGLRTFKGVLVLLGLAGLLLALLRPQHGGREQLVRRYGTDVVIAVDFSRSMLAEDVPPSRIARVRMEIDRLLGDLSSGRLGALEGNRVGAVAFAGDAIAFPLSTDLQIAATFFRNFDPARMNPPGTAIGRAVRKAQQLLEEAEAPAADAARPDPDRPDDRARIIVLFTDGEDHEGDPIAAARRAEDEVDARLFVVQVGELGATTIPVRDPETGEIHLHRSPSGTIATTEITPQVEQTLLRIASPRPETDPEEDDRLLFRLGAEGSVSDQIAAELRRQRRTEIEARKVVLYDELYWIALLPAALLLAAEAALPGGRQRRRRLRSVPRPGDGDAQGEEKAP
jgi:Ca-activated chloride channel family protein